MNEERKVAGIYIRVSTEDQAYRNKLRNCKDDNLIKEYKEKR